MTVKEEKELFRSRYSAYRTSLPPEKKRQLDSAVANNLLASWHYKKSALVLTYVSKESEIDTLKIMTRAFREKKRVAVPYTLPETCTLEFYYVFSLGDLRPGRFGILEPVPDESRKVRDFSDSICLVPAFCFDRRGFRVGYGKGYYDRFLCQYEGYGIGLTYSETLCDRVPAGKHDQKVKAIFTERSVKYVF